MNKAVKQFNQFCAHLFSSRFTYSHCCGAALRLQISRNYVLRLNAPWTSVWFWLAPCTVDGKLSTTILKSGSLKRPHRGNPHGLGRRHCLHRPARCSRKRAIRAPARRSYAGVVLEQRTSQLARGRWWGKTSAIYFFGPRAETNWLLVQTATNMTAGCLRFAAEISNDCQEKF